MAAKKPLVVQPDGSYSQLSPGDVLDAELLNYPPGPDIPAFSFEARLLDSVSRPRGCPVGIAIDGVSVTAGGAAQPVVEAVGLLAAAADPGDLVGVQVAGMFSMVDWSDVVGTVQLPLRSILWLSSIARARMTANRPEQAGQLLQACAKAVSYQEAILLFNLSTLL